MESSHKIIVSLLAIIILLSATNLGIATLGASSSVSQLKPASGAVAEQTDSEIETSSKSDEKYLFIKIPARPDIVMKEYFEDYTVDKALKDIESHHDELRYAHGSYTISIMKGDSIGSVVLSESSCGGDACGIRELAYRNGVQQLSVDYISDANSIKLVTDGKEYLIQPIYDASCNSSNAQENGVNLLGITVTGGDIVSSYSLPEELNTPCFFNAPNADYVTPYISVNRVYSGWGYFGADLEISDVKVMVHFSDEVTEQIGTWQ